MDGEPDGKVTVTQGFGPIEDVKKIFGGSRLVGTRTTTVYVNGIKFYRLGKVNEA